MKKKRFRIYYCRLSGPVYIQYETEVSARSKERARRRFYRTMKANNIDPKNLLTLTIYEVTE